MDMALCGMAFVIAMFSPRREVPAVAWISAFPENWEMSVQIGEKAKYPENWEKCTVINLVPTLRKDQIALIFDCGDSDFFLEVNKNYHEALLKQGIDHDFITRPGNHDSQYWNNSIDYQILFFDKFFKK